MWTTTVEEHRRTVHTAILDTTAALVAEHGLTVTMSQIAQRTGIGRATLYKYFPDVESILAAWHERQITTHLDELAAVAPADDPGERLRTMLTTYAHLSSGAAPHSPGDGAALARALHHAAHMTPARQRLHDLVTQVIAAAVEAGGARSDVPATELATYCLHALGAAAGSDSPAARDRLVEVTLSGLRPR